jgi:hypothetical protein
MAKRPALVGGEGRGVAEQDGVAVGCGMGDSLGADDGRRPGAVLDDDGLAECLAHGAADDAREIVGAAARRIRHHDPDRPVRVGRLGEAAVCADERERRGAGEHVTAICAHGFPPGEPAAFVTLRGTGTMQV